MADDDPIPKFTREKLARVAEDALQRADVAGIFPTPLEAVQQVAGVRERLDIDQLPDEVRAKKPAVLKRLLGAVWFEERVIFVDTSQSAPRQMFTDAHETVHALCPWHEQILLTDTENELFRGAVARIETEANYGAGHLIFQGGRFHRRALEEQVSMRVPVALADDYGASLHATMHYYAQEHPDAVALLVTGRLRRSDGTVPIFRSVESPEFVRRFGRLKDKLPGDGISLEEGVASPFAEIVNASVLSKDPPHASVAIRDFGGTHRQFIAEAFCNGRNYFVMVIERRARRLGRRGLRIAS